MGGLVLQNFDRHPLLILSRAVFAVWVSSLVLNSSLIFVLTSDSTSCEVVVVDVLIGNFDSRKY